MRKALTLIGVLLFLKVSLKAQDATVQDLKNQAARSIPKDPKDTSKKTWKLGGLLNLI